MNKLQLSVLACCTALASCAPYNHLLVSANINRGVQLAEATAEDGSREVWRAYPGNDAQPRIEKTFTKHNIVPKVGMQVAPMTRERAEACGAMPFQGVWVESVTHNLPAAQAGLVRGDIILQIDGQDVSSTEQFSDLILNRGVPEQPLTFTIRVKRRPGEPIDSDQSTTVAVTPVATKVRKSTTDSIPLDRSEGVQAYTGLQAAMVKPDLARTIYGSEQAVVLVTGVVAGSPAYYAGIRSGDRIQKIDGQEVHSLQDVRDAVLARVQTANPTATMFDLAAERTDTKPVGNRSDDVQIEVNGPLGLHQSTIAVSESVTSRSRFYIPILIDYESVTNQSELGFLNFIFQFGFNYRSRVRSSETRAPVETSSLSILPLGMFRVHHSPRRSDYTLFWLIHFGSDH